MAKFKFDIEDATDGQTPEQSGGEIELGKLKPSSGRTWDVGPPDPRDSIQPVQGGTVESIQGRGRHVVESPAKGTMDSRRVRWEVADILMQLIPTVVLIVLGFLGFGFVEVVRHDIEQNKLDLPTYVKVIGWFVGGLLSLAGGGVALKNFRSDKRKQGDGSG